MKNTNPQEELIKQDRERVEAQNKNQVERLEAKRKADEELSKHS